MAKNVFSFQVIICGTQQFSWKHFLDQLKIVSESFALDSYGSLCHQERTVIGVWGSTFAQVV